MHRWTGKRAQDVRARTQSGPISAAIFMSTSLVAHLFFDPPIAPHGILVVYRTMLFTESEIAPTSRDSLQAGPLSEKNLMSVIFPPAIPGPEMAAPTFWAPGIFWFLLLENPHAHKIPPFRGGGGGGRGCLGFLGRRGLEVPILFYGRGDFPTLAKLFCDKKPLT